VTAEYVARILSYFLSEFEMNFFLVNKSMDFMASFFNEPKTFISNLLIIDRDNSKEFIPARGRTRDGDVIGRGG